MITNERQYNATKASARFFEEALEHADDPYPHHSPELHEALRRGIASDLAHLREELQEYEDFRAGKIREVTIERLDDLPDILIRARIASGLTQRELAEDLEIKEQQVQRYEATRYKSASLTRLISVARALEIEVRIQATLPNGAEFRARRAQINAEIDAMMQRAAEGRGPTDGERPAAMGEVA
jgi:HTH-type transcriptional regulator/antitoxin HigA